MNYACATLFVFVVDIVICHGLKLLYVPILYHTRFDKSTTRMFVEMVKHTHIFRYIGLRNVCVAIRLKRIKFLVMANRLPTQ